MHVRLGALMVVAVVGCGGVDNPDGGGGAGGQGTGASGQGGDGGEPAGSECSPSEGVTASVTMNPLVFGGACTVTAVDASSIGLSCMGPGAVETTTLEIDAEPAIVVGVSMGDDVLLQIETQNLEGPEIWGALRAADGTLLLGWVSAGSLVAPGTSGPWHDPLAIAPGDCSEEDARLFWTVGFEGDEVVVADGQRRTVGPNEEYVVQAAGLHHPEGMVASTPTNTHVAIVARAAP